ncbi:MAG: hypothetical protein K6G07_00640, partial [Lachnospiraceae bacterium]|nr:hypothetical protein [Lachnospiraceae bacterium]
MDGMGQGPNGNNEGKRNYQVYEQNMYGNYAAYGSDPGQTDATGNANPSMYYGGSEGVNGGNTGNGYGNYDSYQYGNMQYDTGSNGGYGYAGDNIEKNAYTSNAPKKSNKAVIIAIVSVLVGLVASICFMFYSVSIINKASDGEYAWDDDDYNYDDDFDWDEDFDWDDEYEWEEEYGNEDYHDYIDWEDETWKLEEPLTDPEDTGDSEGYYMGFANCIDTNVPYKLTMENEEYVDEEHNVCIRYNYYQISDDVINADKINEALHEAAATYHTYFLENQSVIENAIEEYNGLYYVTGDAYITYNDADMLSVAYDIHRETQDDLEYHIFCVNVDLVSGTVYDNADVVDVDSEFAEFFIERSEIQNGAGNSASYYDSATVENYLTDEENVILCYTPCGLEVGFNHMYGWVTITLADYEQYLKS